jgi:hypothetical protein
MNPNIETTADTYLQHHRMNRDEDFWAFEAVDRLVKSDLENAWEITLLLLRKAHTDDALAYVAAGPLEDFLDIYGDSALDLVEGAAKSDSRLRLALSLVWLEASSPILHRWMAFLRRYGFQNVGPRWV